MVFDITHAFRSIPLVAIVVLNYVKVLKRARLKSVVYGAFEALGSIHEVKAMPVERRRVRILDLTPLDQLMDWTIATDRFLATGNAGYAGALARQGVTRILQVTGGTDDAAQAIRRLGESMINFSTMIFTSRGPEISPKASQLVERLQAAAHLNLPRPFRPLFERLEHRLASFRGSPLEDGLAAVRWCMDHNLVQQGYTMLEEIVFSYVLEQVGGDVLNVSQRLAVSQAFTVVARGWVDEPRKWGEDGRKDLELTRKMIHFISAHKGLSKAVALIRERRNDLNHAGFSENSLKAERAGRFSSDLQKALSDVEAVLLKTARGSL